MRHHVVVVCLTSDPDTSIREKEGFFAAMTRRNPPPVSLLLPLLAVATTSLAQDFDFFYFVLQVRVPFVLFFSDSLSL